MVLISGPFLKGAQLRDDRERRSRNGLRLIARGVLGAQHQLVAAGSEEAAAAEAPAEAKAIAARFGAEREAAGAPAGFDSLEGEGGAGRLAEPEGDRRADRGGR